MKAFLLLIAFATLIDAQDEKLASVKGVVVNSITGEPLNKVIVTIYNHADGNKSYGVSTNSTGAFEIRAVDPGGYTLFASRQGFIGGGRSGVGNRGGMAGKIVTLGVGETLDSVKLMLAPQGIIAGRVTDYDGEPLQNAHVQAFVRRWSQGEPTIGFIQSASTNDLGEYRITNLPAGRYFVEAMPLNSQPQFPRQDLKEETYPPIFSPGVTDPAQAQPIEVVAGVVRQGVDIRVFKLASRTLRGKVAIDEGTSIESFILLLAPQSGADGAPARTMTVGLKPDRTFEFREVLPGAYFLLCSTPTSHCRFPIEVRDKNIADIVVRPQPGINLTVHVRWDGPAPPEAQKENTRVIVNLRPLDAAGSGMASDQGKETMVFKSVSTGKYRVAAYSTGAAYVKAIRYGDQEAEGDTIDITEGAELEVVMRQGTGSFEGAIEVDDATVPDVVVLLVPVNHQSRQWLYEEATTDQNGHFKIERIAPGEYDAYAFESIEHGSWFDPEFATKWSRRAERIRIEEKSHESKKLTLIRSGN